MISDPKGARVAEPAPAAVRLRDRTTAGSRITDVRRTAGFRRFVLPVFALAALALLPGCAGGWMPGRTRDANTAVAIEPESRPDYNRRVYDASWDAVRSHYYDPSFNGVNWNAARERHRPAAVKAADDDALYHAINALMDELKDEHTYAETPEEAEEESTTEGILIGLVTTAYGESDPRRTVVEVMPGSSAEQAGVEPGWVLVSCEDKPPGDVLGLGKLHDGQSVRCAFIDEQDSPRTLELVARRLSIAPARTVRVLSGGWICMRFDRFDLATARWVRATLRKHVKAPGIVVDLRENPGGEALALARALGEFFPHSVPMGEFVRRSGVNERLRASPGWKGARYRGRVAVLVSENSGSSAEIFAHAMQQLGRAVIVGTKTAGAVLGAETGMLPGGGELQISVRDYRGIDGRRLEGVGVMPDVVVRPTVHDRRAGQDRVLEAALLRLRTGPLPEPKY